MKKIIILLMPVFICSCRQNETSKQNVNNEAIEGNTVIHADNSPKCDTQYVKDWYLINGSDTQRVIKSINCKGVIDYPSHNYRITKSITIGANEPIVKG